MAEPSLEDKILAIDSTLAEVWGRQSLSEMQVLMAAAGKQYRLKSRAQYDRCPREPLSEISATALGRSL